jgi:cytochrome P450
MAKRIPIPGPQTGLRALQSMLHEGHPLAAMQVFHRELGDIFRVNLPGFKPVVMAGPQAAHFVLVEGRSDLRWRNPDDPVTALLRHGVLVEDGALHDDLRRQMSPALHRRMLEGYLQAMYRAVEKVSSTWPSGGVVDMLVEMRKIALLILVETLFDADFSPELTHLWQPILDTIAFISPGAWMVWRGAPRPQYRHGLQTLDAYLYRLIAERRRSLDRLQTDPTDLLGVLLVSGMDEARLRDQLLTMLIAGHDTSTALLAWSLYLLGSNPDVMRLAVEEAAVLSDDDLLSMECLNSLELLGNVIREALRLYPPIHLGSRLAADDLEYDGYIIPKGERVIYSIYLTQRHPKYWQHPDAFLPERYADPSAKTIPYAWLAFGGGPRNCIGAAFGQMESRLVLAYVLKHFDLALVERRVHAHMGATLEPRPGVRMRVHRR